MFLWKKALSNVSLKAVLSIDFSCCPSALRLVTPKAVKVRVSRVNVDVNPVNFCLHQLPPAASMNSIIQGVNLRLKQTSKAAERNHAPHRLLAPLSGKRELLHEFVGAKRVNACKEWLERSVAGTPLKVASCKERHSKLQSARAWKSILGKWL